MTMKRLAIEVHEVKWFTLMNRGPDVPPLPGPIDNAAQGIARAVFQELAPNGRFDVTLKRPTYLLQRDCCKCDGTTCITWGNWRTITNPAFIDYSPVFEGEKVPFVVGPNQEVTPELIDSINNARREAIKGAKETYNDAYFDKNFRDINTMCDWMN